MSILDAGPIYTNTGDVLQIQYAQKRADSGNTCIALKSKHGVVMLVEKPIENNLYLSETEEKILKVTDEIYQMATGIETDLKHLNLILRQDLLDIKYKNDEPISPELFRKHISQDVYDQTIYFSYRVYGINIISCVKYENEFKIVTTGCDGNSVFMKASAIGKGSRLAKTELEKLDLESMSIKELVENGVRIMYKAFDPVKDKSFNIEIGLFSKEREDGFIRLKKEEFAEIVEKYKDLSVDDDE